MGDEVIKGNNLEFISTLIQEENPLLRIREISDRWGILVEAEKKIILNYFLKRDVIKAQINQSKVKYEDAIALFDRLNVIGKSDIANMISKEYPDFLTKILNYYEIINTEAYDYLTSEENYGFSKKDILDIYINNKYFHKATDEYYEEHVKFMRAMGISDEQMKSNPLLFSLSSTNIYAKIKFFEQLGEDFKTITDEKIKMLVSQNADFEREWGFVVREELKKSYPDLYESLFGNKENTIQNRGMIINNTMLALRKMNPLTPEILELILNKKEQKNTKDTEVIRQLESISLNDEQFMEFILPPEKSGRRSRGDFDTNGPSDNTSIGADGLSPAELEAELRTRREAEAFRRRLISEFGEEYNACRYMVSKGGDNSKFMSYMGMKIGEYTVLEAVGHPGNNATYVIPTVFLDVLPVLTRQDIRDFGIGFRLYHSNQKSNEYNYKSNHLFHIFESLKEAQKDNKTRFSGEELISTVRKLNEKSIVDVETIRKSKALREILGSDIVAKSVPREAKRDFNANIDEQVKSNIKGIEKNVKREVKAKKEADKMENGEIE